MRMVKWPPLSLPSSLSLSSSSSTSSSSSSSSPSFSSGLGAAPLLVDLDLMLEAVVQLKVVVLQRGGAARRQAAVGARAVEQQAGAHGA